MQVDILALRRPKDRRLAMVGSGVFLVLAMLNTALVASIGLTLTARLLLAGVGLGLVTRAFRLESVERPSNGLGPGPRYGAFALVAFVGVASMFAFSAVVDTATKRPVPDAYRAAIHHALTRCAESNDPTPSGCPQAQHSFQPGGVRWALLGEPLDGAVYHDAIFGPGWVEGVAIFSSSDFAPWPTLSAHPTGYVAEIRNSAGDVRLRASAPSRAVVKRRPALSVGMIEDSVTNELRKARADSDVRLGFVWTDYDRMTGIFTVRGSYRYNAEDLGGQRCRMFFAKQVMVLHGDPYQLEYDSKRYCRGVHESGRR
jgi:hypothetical protein